jgi:hypothetical protein
MHLLGNLIRKEIIFLWNGALCSAIEFQKLFLELAK